MKYLSLLILLSLTSCILPDTVLKKDVLHTAPKNIRQLINCDSQFVLNLKGPTIQKDMLAFISLQNFLNKNEISHEILTGKHMMIKLKDIIQFERGSEKVSKGYLSRLNLIGKHLSKNRKIDTIVSGHTDNTGSIILNDALSLRRAQEVKEILTFNNGVSADSIFTLGYGKHIPLCKNKTKIGKACNRRAEIFFISSND
ncbi:outer membrane protein [Candidatus Photodesmus blepharus]|uniref:Outer membrane protein n=1 Tax=Candidatus Photodesmus blepharonis TaxID=1179155 RepID=A0A084CNG1_9GAMM|nr:OmpA family protein [Candidatus Photodesmus blepharus]KEY91340.1 outer membrane protein [Candidatus Photodesmus blepharus]